MAGALPFEKFILVSKLSPIELSYALEQSIAEPRFHFIRGPERPFEGRVDNEGFSISWIPFAQGYGPKISGYFEAIGNITHITVTQKPPLVGVLFILVWLGSVMLLGIIPFSSFFGSGQTTALTYLPTVFLSLFFLFGIYLFLRFFWDEARLTKHILKLIFQAEEL